MIFCDFQRFFSFRNKARNAGCSHKNAGNKPKCGISRTIAGRLTPMHMQTNVDEVSLANILVRNGIHSRLHSVNDCSKGDVRQDWVWFHVEKQYGMEKDEVLLMYHGGKQH